MEKGVRLDEEKLCDRQHRVFIFPSQNILQKDIRDNGYEELSIYMEWGWETDPSTFHCPQLFLNDMHSFFILEASMLHHVVKRQWLIKHMSIKKSV